MRLVGGGELARDTDADAYVSASEPKSPGGLSGRLVDDKLCRRDPCLVGPVADAATDDAFTTGTAASGFGVSTTRKTRG